MHFKERLHEFIQFLLVENFIMNLYTVSLKPGVGFYYYVLYYLTQIKLLLLYIASFPGPRLFRNGAGLGTRLFIHTHNIGSIL